MIEVGPKATTVIMVVVVDMAVTVGAMGVMVSMVVDRGGHDGCDGCGEHGSDFCGSDGIVTMVVMMAMAAMLRWAQLTQNMPGDIAPKGHVQQRRAAGRAGCLPYGTA